MTYVTFWLEGVLLPVISVFGLIGKGNIFFALELRCFSVSNITVL